ncbi:TonB-dependent receptor [Sphingopyxis sp. OAS728]|uniref:TonB-dependent receptor n=1 Tax=Sphingopyxis sp. OAS728 TaxID=2663823 RepID=UPI001CEF31CE|nr:TonB-dependent receptor plug domain-containing protein [Sphingopyxis sp. OAS728]
MIDRVKSVRLLATAAVILCPASVASAQQAAAETSAASSGGLEEIVVTARKREESMQDVPASISALSAGELDRRFDSDVRDFADSSPNIVIDDTQQGPGGVAAVYIRGIGVADVEKSVDPAVGVVFDDIYIGQSSGSLLKAIDIDRVEVLRGPQGTLFGRNATGGVINLARSRPTYDLTGKARLTYGRFDSWKVEGVASTGLTDNVAVKVSGAYEKSDGYIFNSFQNQDGQRSKFYAISGALRSSRPTISTSSSAMTTRRRSRIRRSCSRSTGRPTCSALPIANARPRRACRHRGIAMSAYPTAGSRRMRRSSSTWRSPRRPMTWVPTCRSIISSAG